MTTFKALESSKGENQNTLSIIERSINDLPEGDLLIKVNYSSLNYKDALSASGSPGVTRNYPHTPGIDAVGNVQESNNPTLKRGTLSLLLVMTSVWILLEASDNT